MYRALESVDHSWYITVWREKFDVFDLQYTEFIIQLVSLQNISKTKSQNDTPFRKYLLSPWNIFGQDYRLWCTSSGHILQLCNVSSILIYQLKRSWAYVKYGQTWWFLNSKNNCLQGDNKNQIFSVIALIKIPLHLTLSLSGVSCWTQGLYVFCTECL